LLHEFNNAKLIDNFNKTRFFTFFYKILIVCYTLHIVKY
jgi:hypothetical protein